MRKTRLLAVAVSAAAILGLAACGSDNKKSSSTSTSTPTTTGTSTAGSGQFAAQANATCSQFQSRLTAIQKRAQTAASGSASARAAVLNDTATLLDELNTKLKSITPPANKQAQYNQLVKAFETVATDYRAGAKAFESGDTNGARTKTQAGVTASAQGVRVATALKLPACGAGGGGTG